MCKETRCIDCMFCYKADDLDVAFCDYNKWFIRGEEMYEVNLDGEPCIDFQPEIGGGCDD